MKKMLSVLLTGAMVIGLAACSSSNSDTDDTAAGDTGTEGSAAQTEAEGGTVSATEEDAGTEAAEITYDTPEYTLIFSTGDSETNIMCKLWKQWADKVYEVTQGRVQVEMHYNGELVETPMAVTAMQQGTVDVAFVIQGTDTTTFPLDPLFEVVPSDQPPVQCATTMYTELLDYSDDFAAEYEDFHVVCLFSQSMAVVASKGFELQSASDLKGKNIAVCSALQATMLDKLGASGVFCEPNSEYTSLEKGIVDGAWYLPWDSMVTQSWAEQLDYILMQPNHTSTNGILISKSAWDSLPEEVQEQIDSIQPWFLELCDKTIAERNIECMQIVEEDYGVNLVWASDEVREEFQAVKDEAVDEYVAELEEQGIDASGFVEAYQELYDKYSADEYQFVDFDMTEPVW